MSLSIFHPPVHPALTPSRRVSQAFTLNAHPPRHNATIVPPAPQARRIYLTTRTAHNTYTQSLKTNITTHTSHSSATLTRMHVRVTRLPLPPATHCHTYQQLHLFTHHQCLYLRNFKIGTRFANTIYRDANYQATRQTHGLRINVTTLRNQSHKRAGKNRHRPQRSKRRCYQ